jgi:hypothetical protein
MFLDVFNPGDVASVTFYLCQEIPNDSAAALYYSLPPYNHLEFIGAIANPRPSDIF